MTLESLRERNDWGYFGVRRKANNGVGEHSRPFSSVEAGDLLEMVDCIFLVLRLTLLTSFALNPAFGDMQARGPDTPDSQLTRP